MTHRIGIPLAVLAAAAVIAVCVASFACGGVHSAALMTANSHACPSSCPRTAAAMAQCPYMQQMESQQAANAKMASAVCGDAKYYGANVYTVQDGHQYAVCEGRSFEVCSETLYVQVQNARYFLDDPWLSIACRDDPSVLTTELDREAVALATVDGNIVGMEDGRLLARCPVTGKIFIVTADSPVRVMNGERYYFSDTVNLASAGSDMHK
jgi:hypothetical protein